MNEVTPPHQPDSWDFTRCTSCTLEFSPESGPQLLPCLHTLCVRCFAVSEKITECPVCQEKCEPNEVIRNLLLAKHHMNLSESNECSSCNNPSRSGWCNECQESLCSMCVAAHRRAEATQEHYVRTVTPACPRPLMCPIHNQEVISNFCLTCEQLTCWKCPSLHPNHPLQSSHEALDKQTKEIRQMVQKVQQKSPSVQKSLKDLQGRLSDLEELQARFRLDVKNTVARLCDMVLKKASKLLKEIEDVCRSEKEKIEERRTILQRLKGKQDHVLAFTQEVLDSQDHTVLLSCRKQIHHQLQNLLEQTAFPMSTMMELYFHSNEPNVKKVIKAFGCIEAREVPFACSEPRNVPKQTLTPNIQKTCPPSTTGQEPSPSSAPLPQISSTICNKDDPIGLAPKSSPNSSIRARLSSSLRDDKYSSWPRSKRSWSYRPYQPRDTPQIPQWTSKPISCSNKRSLLAPSQVNIAHSSPREPSGPGASRVEAGSSSTWSVQTPVQVIWMIPSTNIQRVASCLSAVPSGSDGNKQEVKLSDLPDQSGLQTSKQLNLEGNLFSEPLKSPDMPNPDKAVKNVSNSNHSQSGSDLRDCETNSSAPQNLPAVLTSLTTDTTTLQEVKSLDETLIVTSFESSPHCPPECMLKSEKEKTDTGTQTINNSIQRVTVKEQHEDVEITTFLNSRYSPLKSEEKDDENGTPVMKIRDKEGNLVVLESLGREWLPHVSLSRLSIRDYPSLCPPALRVVKKDCGDGFLSSVTQEDGKSVVPRSLSHRLLAKQQHCASCRLSGKLFQCRVCQRAFHRDCHLPVISLTTTDRWQCVLCRDFSYMYGDREADPGPSSSSSSPCLSLYEQRKCEYLLLSLSCHEHSSALYRSATPLSSRHVNVTLVRGRLMGKIAPPYRTPAEFVSDLWLLVDTLNNSSEEASHVEHLQRFFSKQLHSVFGADLHPSLLTDPYRRGGTERERKLRVTRKLI